MPIPGKYKKNIFYKTFNQARLIYFEVLVFLQKLNFKFKNKTKLNITNKIKTRVLQEKILFEEFGFNNYLYRINRKINFFKFKNEAEKIKKHKINSAIKISDVLIISGCENTVAEIHRVNHLIEKLNIIKIKHTVIQHSKFHLYKPKDLISYDLIWIHRAASEPIINKMIDIWKSLSIPILYDIDDLVFDTKIIPYISAISDWPKEKIQLYEDTMKRYDSLIRNINFVSSPTNFLSNYLFKMYNKPYFVIRNGLDKYTEKKLLEINHASSNEKNIIIGYFSGTKTHDKDFLQCSKALISIMKKYKNVKLKIVGELELPKTFYKFKKRIIKKHLVPYKDLYKEYRDININIAPLELNNPYCESKSELKYYFAAFAGIPTIATPTDSYMFAIEDSVNGFLAKTQNEWYQKLEKLISDHNLYNKISRNCKLHATNVYSQTNQAKEIQKIILTIQESKK